MSEHSVHTDRGEARYDRPMTADVYPLQVLLVTLAGWINRHQQHVIEYLVEENRVLKGQMKERRLRLTDDQRRRLAVKGRRLGRRVLRQVATIVTPDTILLWHRQLIARKWTFTPTRPGGPGVMKEISTLIVRMATENPCRAQELDPPSFPSARPCEKLPAGRGWEGVSMIRWAGRAIAVWAKPRAGLIVENLCLRQQLIVLQRRVPRPRLRDGDRRFWILVCRWFPKWRDSLLVVQPNTVLRWHRRGWTAYWRWRSRPRRRGGRPPLPRALRALIRRMSVENRLWGQRRVQAELARLGFPVSARTGQGSPDCGTSRQLSASLSWCQPDAAAVRTHGLPIPACLGLALQALTP